MAQIAKRCEYSPHYGGGFMKGSIQKDKRSGLFFILLYWHGKQWRFWRDPFSKQSFRDSGHAEKLLNIVRGEIDRGTFDPDAWKVGRKSSGSLSVKKYATSWLERHDVSAKTLKDYKNAVHNYIIPYFGNRLLTSITRNDLLEFKGHIEREQKTVYNIISVLRVILNAAFDNGDITKVPKFPTLSYELKEQDYLTFDEQELVIAQIPIRHRPIYRFMQEYGVRPGEARGLMKDCLKHGYVVIRRAFAENKLRETTKTGTVRKYVITSYFQGVLNNIPSQGSGFVFVRDDGKPYTSKNLNKIWHQACQDAGIRRIKMYNGMRHSLAYQLLEQGEELSLVQEQLGHANIEMTRRYATRPKARLGDALVRRRGCGAGK